MKIIEMKIPTRHGLWKVVLGKFYSPEPAYYVAVKSMFPGLYDRVDNRSVPKSIKRRARSFLANPKLFGRERYI